MGFGAILASGEKNRILRDELMDCLVEVRVEQFLDEPTRFAVRFQEDLGNGGPMIMQADELQCARMITIAVPVGEALRCLVRGPVTGRKSAMTLGGPGSWFEIHGQDRRIEMDRRCRRRSWFGLESAAAEAILKNEYRFGKTCIQQTRMHYGSTRTGSHQDTTSETLNQRATDEAFLRQIACRNNLHFWIEYRCRPGGLDPAGEALEVVEIANLRASPPRPADGPDCPAPLGLERRSGLTLRVNVEKERCQNVTSFGLTEEVERPSRFRGTAIDVRAGEKRLTEATDRQPPQARGGKGLAHCAVERELCLTTAGNEEELRRKAESALTEAGWFIEASASTTAHMLGGVLLPHDEVEVEGLGDAHSGRYQVKAVTHVINAVDHFMDLQLRRNAFGGD